MQKVDRARLDAFRRVTLPEERDRVAFLQFEDVVEEAVAQAAMVDPDTDPERSAQECALLRSAFGEMLFRLVTRIGLWAVLANAEGIGYAVHYGLVDSTANGMDEITSPEDLDALCARAAVLREASAERLRGLLNAKKADK